MLPIIKFYKTPISYEIACMLFENCNLQCDFCFEAHARKKIDTKYIEDIYKIIDENFSKEYNKYPTIKTVYIMLWGGELFFDSLSDDVFNSYYILIDNIKTLFKNKFQNVDVIFSWLSNGVFTKKERVKKIIEYSKGIINFSYDPISRFKIKKQEELMIQNAIYFKNIGLGKKISITLTKPSINAFINNTSKLKFFNDLNYNIDVNYYIANPNWKNLLPTDNEIFLFFKWAFDNSLFNIKVCEKILDYFFNKPVRHYCDCKTCSQITFGEWSVDCAKCSSILPAESFYGKETQNITEENSNEIKATIGIHKRGCLTCDYYNNCQMPCWISIVFDGFKAENCFYKQTYDYIKNNKKILENYICWLNHGK